MKTQVLTHMNAQEKDVGWNARASMSLRRQEGSFKKTAKGTYKELKEMKENRGVLFH